MHASVLSVWQALRALLCGMFLVACVPRKEQVIVCSDPERCKEQEPLCDNSCEYASDRSACLSCCADMLHKCLNCEPGVDFRDCKR